MKWNEKSFDHGFEQMFPHIMIHSMSHTMLTSCDIIQGLNIYIFQASHQPTIKSFVIDNILSSANCAIVCICKTYCSSSTRIIKYTIEAIDSLNNRINDLSNSIAAT